MLERIESLSKGPDSPMMLSRDPTLRTPHEFSDLPGSHFKDIEQFKNDSFLYWQSKRQFPNHPVEALLINLLTQPQPMILHKGIGGNLLFLNPLKGIVFGRRAQGGVSLPLSHCSTPISADQGFPMALMAPPSSSIHHGSIRPPIGHLSPTGKLRIALTFPSLKETHISPRNQVGKL